MAEKTPTEPIWPGGGAGLVRVPRAVMEELRRHALEDAPNEACGLIACDENGNLQTVHRCRNGATDPAVSYAVDPRDLLSHYRRLEEYPPDDRRAAFNAYHSRPAPTAFLSVEDQRGFPWFDAGGQLVIVAVYEGRVDQIAIYSWDSEREAITGRLLASEDDMSWRIAVRTLSDRPITQPEEDLLGYGDYAAALADFIRNRTTSTPLAVSVEGPWGSGKSSLMNLLRERLEMYGLITITFNAWRFEKREELLAGLAAAIMDQTLSRWTWLDRLLFADRLAVSRVDRRRLYLDSVDVRFWFAIAGILAGSTLAAALMSFPLHGLVALLGALASLGGILGLVTSLILSVINPFRFRISNLIRDPNYRQRAGVIESFRHDFEQIVALIKDFEAKRRSKELNRLRVPPPPSDEVGQPGRLVVLVDDLDRCTPESICEILQAINLTLACPEVVFVLGMDVNIVEAAIEVRYGPVAAAAPLAVEFGQLFLEKIVQLRLRLPSRRSQSASYIDALLSSKRQDETTSPFWGRPQAGQSYRRQVEQVTEVAEQIEKEAKDLDGIARALRSLSASWANISPAVLIEARRKAFADLFTEESSAVRRAFESVSSYLEGNPRNIKRFLNLFRLRAAIVEVQGGFEQGLNYELLARWVLLSMRWPHVSRACEKDCALLSRTSEVAGTADPALKGFIERWPKAERSLEKVSLLSEF